MDSNELERERGITILAKNTRRRLRGRCTSISSTRPATPDFGGEVETLALDGGRRAAAGGRGRRPMPQTRFVTRKALA